MSRPNRILIVMSSHADLGISGKRTGTWFEEVATPYYEFVDAGSRWCSHRRSVGRPPSTT